MNISKPIDTASRRNAESSTTSLSMISTVRVLRPQVASISAPRSLESCTIRLIGADSGPTIAITRSADTMLPKPILTSCMTLQLLPVYSMF